MKQVIGGVVLTISTVPSMAAQQQGASVDAPRNAQQEGQLNRNQIAQPTTTVVAPTQEAITKEKPTPKVATWENGIEAGSFLLFPDLNLSGTYDTNIYASRTNEIDDWVWAVTPSLQARSNWDKHQLNANVGVNTNRYQTTTTQNTDNYWASTDGLFEISQQTNVYGGLSYSRDHEDRASPDAAAGRTPTIYHDSSAYVGAFHDFGAISARFGATAEYLDFDNVRSETGSTIINDDRDRDITSYGGRVSYPLDKALSLFAQGVWNRRDYRETPDSPVGYYRDSDGYQVDIGAALNLNNKTVGEAYMGRRAQDYSDNRLDDVSVPDYGVDLRYHTSPWTTYKLSVARSIEETVLAGASSYVNTRATASVERDLGPRTVATASYTQGVSDFQGIDRLDNYATASLGVKHYLDQAVYVGANFDLMRRNSNDQDANYGQNMLGLSIGSDLGAHRSQRYFAYEKQTDLDFASHKNDASYFDGVYIGAGYGVGNLSVNSSGPRDGGNPPGNADSGQFADSGELYGLFAGIGKTFDQWYIGAEVAKDRANADVNHVHAASNPDEALTFGTERKDGWVASLRGGFVLQTGPLLYARVGHAHANFGNILQDETVTVNSDTTRSGTQVGIGTDIPAGDNLFVRMDYSHTNYTDYNVVLDKPSPDNYDELYDNRTGDFQLGVGYLFGGARAHQQPSVDPTFLRGIYVGAQAGYGGVFSDLHAMHAHPSNAPAYSIYDTLDATFGNEGATGAAFAGYAYTFDRVYVAAELDIEDGAKNSWAHDRNPGGGSGGRDYSLAKKDGYGAALKLGYVLPNGTVLYGRGGPVKTRFSTYYARGAGSDAVDQDETLGGMRFGVGAELPINKKAFWRIDYTITDYKDYDFTSLQNNPANRDAISLNTKENLFQIGVGYRM